MRCSKLLEAPFSYNKNVLIFMAVFCFGGVNDLRMIIYQICVLRLSLKSQGVLCLAFSIGQTRRWR